MKANGDASVRWSLVFIVWLLSGPTVYLVTVLPFWLLLPSGSGSLFDALLRLWPYLVVCWFLVGVAAPLLRLSLRDLVRFLRIAYLVWLTLAAMLVISTVVGQRAGVVEGPGVASSLYFLLWMAAAFSVIATVFPLVVAWSQKHHISLRRALEIGSYALPAALAIFAALILTSSF